MNVAQTLELYQIHFLSSTSSHSSIRISRRQCRQRSIIIGRNEGSTAIAIAIAITIIPTLPIPRIPQNETELNHEHDDNQDDVCWSGDFIAIGIDQVVNGKGCSEEQEN